MNKLLMGLLCLCFITSSQAQLSSVINKFPAAKTVQADYAELDPTFNWPSPKTNPIDAIKYMMVTGPAGATYGDVNSTPTSLAIVTGGTSGYPATLFGNKCYRYRINNTRDASTRTELYWGSGGCEFSDAQWFMAGIYVPAGTCMDHRPFGLGFDFKHADAQGPASANLKVVNGRWQYNIDFPQGSGETKYDLGVVETGKWTYILVNRNFEPDASGFQRVYKWVQGTTPVFTQVLNTTGGNYALSCGANTEGYVLWGPYVWGASGNEGSGPCDASGYTMSPSYTFYYDNIIIAKSTATLTDFNNFISGATAPSNVPPVANAGPNQTIAYPGTSAVLDGTDSDDSDGTITDYLWEKLSGGSVTFSDATAASPTVSGMSAGVYVFRLTVTDNDGATHSDDVQITINGASPTANGPRFTTDIEGGCTEATYGGGGCPVVAIPDLTITSPTTTLTTTFYAVHGDEGRWITTFDAVYLSYPGGASPLETQVPPQDTYIPTEGHWEFTDLTVNGTYVVEVTVTDNIGSTVKDTFNIVRGSTGNTLPTVNAGSDVNLFVDNTGPFQNTSTTLYGVTSDADGTISSRQWTKIAGPDNVAFASATSDTTAVTMLSAGAYTFRLLATDNSSGSSYDDVNINVITANAGLDTVITAPANSAPLTGTNIGGTVSSVLWTKTSGTGGSITNSTSLNATATDLSVGAYTFQLEITFSTGSKARDVKQIIVVAAGTTILKRVSKP